MKYKISFGTIFITSTLLFLGAGCSLFSSSTSVVPESTKDIKNTVPKTEVTMEENVEVATNTAPVSEKMEKKEVFEEKMMSTGSYETYSSDKLGLANENNVVLFFHAPWCPTCKAANASFEASGIPAGLAILKVDYDSSTELKKKYGVTYQHTFVQVDASGNMIKKWSGGSTIESVVNQVQ